MAGFTSLRHKLFLGVLVLVAASALLMALLAHHRYSLSLREALAAQAHNLAQATALQATDKVLVNDLVGLQKMLDDQRNSHEALRYSFVLRDGQVLAHTFPKGVPVDLVGANPAGEARPGLAKIRSLAGEGFLDVSWPIFEGRAGVLRLGLTEANLDRQLAGLMLEVAGAALAILVLALAAAHLFIGRITQPLSTLVQATRRIDRGERQVRVAVAGGDEVGVLAASFNQMVGRLEEHTRRLEEQTAELLKVNQQTGLFCQIVQEIGSLSSLEGVGSFMIRRLKEISGALHLALAVFNAHRETLFVLSESGAIPVHDPGLLQTLAGVLETGESIVVGGRNLPASLPLPPDFSAAERLSTITLEHAGQIQGALFLGCPRDCPCQDKDFGLIRLILTQSAGVILRAVAHEEEISGLQQRQGAAAEFSGLVGKDPKMRLVYRLIEDVAPTEATVLIQGESGTGKELVARAIHDRSPRRDRPFVVINCAAYPVTLLESELFGHEKGAFTGAVRQKMGRFEQAEGGTVFLDEVGEIPPAAQVKLLRVLQTQQFERVGGERTLTVDVRLLAATHRDLREEVKQGRFREDLFYRLNVIPVVLPPLRERRNDIPLLARRFLRRFADQQGKSIKDFDPAALRLLLDADWPGNVRELENAVEHAVVLAKEDLILAGDLPPYLRAAAPAAALTMTEHERKLVVKTLEECGWNKKEAARRLKISRSSLYDKIRRFQITPPTRH